MNIQRIETCLFTKSPPRHMLVGNWVNNKQQGPKMQLESRNISNRTNQYRWLSPIRVMVIFLYSLLFLGIHFKTITSTCLLLTFPFLPLAYLAGSLTIGILHNDMGYLLGAWAAVFLQAYVLASVVIWLLAKREEINE